MVLGQDLFEVGLLERVPVALADDGFALGALEVVEILPGVGALGELIV